MPTLLSASHRWVALAAVAALSMGAAMAAPDGLRDGVREGAREGAHGGVREGMRDGSREVSRDGAWHDGQRRDGPPDARGRTPNVGPNRWYDGAHGHSHAYPVPGWTQRVLPPRSHGVYWGGVSYNFFDGIWYSPGPRGYVVVRPPFGIVVADLPSFRSLVVIGGIAYLYANGVYYRERGEGGYEVVPTPVAPDVAEPIFVPPPLPLVSPPYGVTTTNPSSRLYVYPRQGQSAEKQASDEYECHRWAVAQSGFDPTAAATATAAADPSRRSDYQRARAACLEGRGYTVR